MQDITLKDTSNFVLWEYSVRDSLLHTLLEYRNWRRVMSVQEEHPPVISNVGMGSIIVNYYRKKDPQDSFIPRVSFTTRLSWSSARLVILTSFLIFWARNRSTSSSRRIWWISFQDFRFRKSWSNCHYSLQQFGTSSHVQTPSFRHGFPRYSVSFSIEVPSLSQTTANRSGRDTVSISMEILNTTFDRFLTSTSSDKPILKLKFLVLTLERSQLFRRIDWWLSLSNSSQRTKILGSKFIVWLGISLITTICKWDKSWRWAILLLSLCNLLERLLMYRFSLDVPVGIHGIRTKRRQSRFLDDQTFRSSSERSRDASTSRTWNCLSRWIYASRSSNSTRCRLHKRSGGRSRGWRVETRYRTTIGTLDHYEELHQCEREQGHVETPWRRRSYGKRRSFQFLEG